MLKKLKLKLQLFARPKVMSGRTPLDGRMAYVYVTLPNGERRQVLSFKNFEGKFDKEKTKVPRTGTTIDGNRSVGGSGTWTATMYYVTDFFRELMFTYIETGEDFYFDIQTTNEDPTSKNGRHTVVYEGCNIDGIVLSKLDVESKLLDEQLNGTFEFARMPEMFTEVEGEM